VRCRRLLCPAMVLGEWSLDGPLQPGSPLASFYVITEGVQSPSFASISVCGFKTSSLGSSFAGCIAVCYATVRLAMRLCVIIHGPLQLVLLLLDWCFLLAESDLARARSLDESSCHRCPCGATRSCLHGRKLARRHRVLCAAMCDVPVLCVSVFDMV
jgi:hypothetical protein